MKKLKLALFACALIASVNVAQGQVQDYKSAIGLRLGYPISLSYKTFITEPGAIEAYVGFRGYSFYRYFNLGAMYQHHFPINASGLEGLAWFVGGGANLLFYSWDSGFANDGNFGVGINAAIGLDYKFKDIPLNLSIDWIPTFYVTGYLSGFGGGLGALSARYVLN